MTAIVGAPFARSASFVTVRSQRRPQPCCRHCGSSLAGRLEGVRECDGASIYACPCGRKRFDSRAAQS